MLSHPKKLKIPQREIRHVFINHVSRHFGVPVRFTGTTCWFLICFDAGFMPNSPNRPLIASTAICYELGGKGEFDGCPAEAFCQFFNLQLHSTQHGNPRPASAGQIVRRSTGQLFRSPQRAYCKDIFDKETELPGVAEQMLMQTTKNVALFF